jgi:hypothetical protein
VEQFLTHTGSNKISFVALKTALSFFLFIGVIANSYSQAPNKTIKDSVFELGDVVKIPKIAYDLSKGCPILSYWDSVKVVASFIEKHTDLRFRIENYTDQRGSSDKNTLTSKYRARCLAQMLYTFGVDSSMIISVGCGESNPIIPQNTIDKALERETKEKLYAINRRTVLKVVSVKGK